jgi:hypothetical protein
MTRLHTATRLLEHGPLSHQEFTEITGWTPRQATATLAKLQESEVVKSLPRPCSGQRTRLYALASSSTANGSANSMKPTPAERMTTTGSFCHG